MLFCITATYAPKALNALMDNPTTSRVAAVTNLLEAAGGKLISMYSTVRDGPGAMVIFDVPDPTMAPAISGVIMSSGSVRDIQLMRLMSPEEVTGVRTKAAKLRSAYTPPA